MYIRVTLKITLFVCFFSLFFYFTLFYNNFYGFIGLEWRYNRRGKWFMYALCIWNKMGRGKDFFRIEIDCLTENVCV